ncbi:hypothetical protein C8R48DRAFT_705741 [Suillus tomentosus]|nr:hypothetical protein C8R48DRAFT_705741 [Suillus tomentosus]
MSHAQSQDRASYTTSTPIQTLALVMGSESSSMENGARGSSYQDGRETGAISAGQKALGSNFSCNQSRTLAPPEPTSKYTAIIGESLRVGGKDAAGARHVTKSSNESTGSLLIPNAQFLLGTYQVKRTRQTDLPAGYIPPHVTGFPPSQSHWNYCPSSQKPPNPHSLLRATRIEATSPSPARTNRFTQWAEDTGKTNTSVAPASTTDSRQKEIGSSKRQRTSYSANLTPIPCQLRPHCPAKDRLYLWQPLTKRSSKDAQGKHLPLSAADIDRIRDVMVHAYAESTRETYGSGLLVFHVFCDSKTIPEEQRAPASNILIESFISCMVGHYSGKTVSNYVNGVRAWHIVHGAEWSLNDAGIDAMLKAAVSLTPTSAKRDKRKPYTVDLIVAIRGKLNLNNPLDASVFACLTTIFYATARVSEFTVPRLNAFDPKVHVSLDNVRDMQDRQNLITKNFHLPRTKSAPEGEDVHWAKQTGPSDPEEAFINHLQINQPPSNFALFAYRHKDNTHRPLTKPKFLSRLATATRAAGHEPLQGHGIRIGSTLEYLLRNIPFDVVKIKGRWASDAFLIYLRKHAQIMAPYMQAIPTLHDQFLRYTIPPAR